MHTYRLKMKIWFANGLKYKECDLVVQLKRKLGKTATSELKEVIGEYFYEQTPYMISSDMTILEKEECEPVEGYENERVVWSADLGEWLKSTVE